MYLDLSLGMCLGLFLEKSNVGIAVSEITLHYLLPVIGYRKILLKTNSPLFLKVKTRPYPNLPPATKTSSDRKPSESISLCIINL